jgi:hypothetical protein
MFFYKTLMLFTKLFSFEQGHFFMFYRVLLSGSLRRKLGLFTDLFLQKARFCFPGLQ